MNKNRWMRVKTKVLLIGESVKVKTTRKDSFNKEFPFCYMKNVNGNYSRTILSLYSEAYMITAFFHTMKLCHTLPIPLLFPASLSIRI